MERATGAFFAAVVAVICSLDSATRIPDDTANSAAISSVQIAAVSERCAESDLAAFVAAATDSRSDSVAPFFATAAKYDSGCAAAAACALAGERGKAAVPAAVSVVCFDAAFAAAATRRLARVGEEWAEFDADGDDVADFGAAADAAAEDADDDPDDAAVSGAESGDECAH